MTNEERIILQGILENGLSYAEKTKALFQLCEDYSIVQNLDALNPAAAALRQLGESHHDEKVRAWGILYSGFSFAYRREFDAAMEIFQSVLPVFKRLDDEPGIARTNLNIGRIFSLHYKDYPTARTYMEAALQSERELGNAAGIGRVYQNLAGIYNHLKVPKEIITLGEELLPIFERAENKTALCRALNGMAILCIAHLSEIPKGMELAERALQVCRENGDKTEESIALDTIGAGYWSLGEAGRAIEYYSQSLRVAEETGNQLIVGDRLTNAAYGYMLLNDYEKVLELNLRAKNIYEEADRIYDSGWAEMGIGQALLGLGDAAKALEHNLLAVALTEALDDRHGAGYAHFRCGEAFVALERYDEAFVAFNKSHEFRKHSNAKLEIADVQCERGKLLVKFGLIEEAIAVLNESLGVAESINAKAQIHPAHRALSDAYHALEDYPNAFYHFQKSIAVRDEVQSQDNAKKAASMEYLHKQEIQRKEQEATDKILNNVLPVSIIKRLKAGQKLIADTIDSVSVIFADVVGFTPLAARLSAEDLVKLLAFIFNHFDEICRKHGLEKIKTIGDAYMAVAGAPDPCDDHALRCARAAVDMMEDFVIPPDLLHENLKGIDLDFRIGIHTGSVVAGVIGESKFAYDLWGDAVNTASRMESHGDAGKIHVSEEFMCAVGTGRDLSLRFIERSEMDIKGKGMMKTYFLEKIA